MADAPQIVRAAGENIGAVAFNELTEKMVVDNPDVF